MKKMVKRALDYLNPIARLGKPSYSFFFPLIATSSAAILIDFYVNYVLRDPSAVGLFAIFIFIGLILYFSFRDGLRGGFTATFITIIYYFYIIYALNYQGEELRAGLETTIILGALYFLLSWIVGWLKETIDKLIEREANEKRRLQSIMQQLPVGVMIADANGKLVITNKQLDKIVGQKFPQGLVIGKDNFTKTKSNGRLITPTQTPMYLALHSGKQTEGKEFEIERAGKKAYLKASASPIHNKEGKIIAAASIISDITTQKEYEKRKDDFINMASHELKTPIASMNLYISSLLNNLKKINDPKAIKTLKSIEKQTDKLQELTEFLLDVSRLQSGKLNLKKEVFRLDGLIKEIADDFEKTSGPRITVIKPASPINILADRFRIFQVITNLVNNALKYSEESQKVVVSVKKVDGKAIVSVADKGIGIPKELKTKIFDRLYQVDEGKGNTYPGLGMGLYISKGIIKAHKGNIWVKSEKGKGSTFYFSLPIKSE